MKTSKAQPQDPSDGTGVNLLYRLSSRATLLRSPGGELEKISASSFTVDLKKYPSLITLLEQLQQWSSEDDILNAPSGNELLQTFYFLASSPDFSSFLQLRVHSDNGAFALDVDPLPSFHEQITDASFKPTACELHLSRHAYMRRDGEHLVLETPTTPEQVRLSDPGLASSLISALASGRLDLSQNSAEGSTLTALATLLEHLGILTAEPDLELPPYAKGHWEFHDAIFHAFTIGTTPNPTGATWHLKEHYPVFPYCKPPVSDDVIPLPSPAEDSPLAADNLTIGQALTERRSRREFHPDGMSLEELGAFLHHSSRIIKVLDNPSFPSPASLRPSPSGGGLHPLEIYPVVRKCQGLESGTYHYHPEFHQLERLPVSGQNLQNIIAMDPLPMISQTETPVLLFLSARFGRTAIKYQGIAYRLLMQDIGCLYQTWYFAAEPLGLAGCAIGAIRSSVIAKATGIDPLEEPFVGLFTLGRKG